MNGLPALIQAQSPIEASDLLVRLATVMRCGYTVGGVAEPAVTAMSGLAFLPVVVMQAELRARVLMGIPPSAEFEPCPEALFGVRCEVPEIAADGAGTLRAAFLLDAAEDLGLLQQDATVELSSLVDEHERRVAGIRDRAESEPGNASGRR